ncbi:uncharacterized protein METZ01_LOCUS483743, partial [marine metagenome]
VAFRSLTLPLIHSIISSPIPPAIFLA